MMVDVAEGDLKNGLLALVVALVEVIKEALRLQAVKRVEGGGLTEEEVARLGEALLALDTAVEALKREMDIEDSVRTVREGLDRVVRRALVSLGSPVQEEQVERVG